VSDWLSSLSLKLFSQPLFTNSEQSCNIVASVSRQKLFSLIPNRKMEHDCTIFATVKIPNTAKNYQVTGSNRE
jgi:hypothetical protein